MLLDFNIKELKESIDEIYNSSAIYTYILISEDGLSFKYNEDEKIDDEKSDELSDFIRVKTSDLKKAFDDIIEDGMTIVELTIFGKDEDDMTLHFIAQEEEDDCIGHDYGWIGEKDGLEFWK